LARGGRFGALVAHSVKMRALVATLERFAESDTTVLIEGETGSGKELLAQTLHEASRRRLGPFVVFGCSVSAAALALDQLFGHDKGAFTSAHDDRPGAFEDADGGTLFLDEVGDMPLELQPMLLRAIETKRARRVGGKRELGYDVRIVVSTQRNLAEAVRERRFREDLYHRLVVGRLKMPPLRERAEDLPVLAGLFAAELGLTLSPELLLPLATYEWPGNVRELRNAISRLVLDPNAAIENEPKARRSTQGVSLHDARGALRPLPEVRREAADEIERAFLREALRQTDGNLSRAAELAGLTRQALTHLANKHGLHPRQR
jgi:transcriptional regulator with GAF, ATPase, and Fis domain